MNTENNNPNNINQEINFIVTDMHCASCVAAIEKGLHNLPGVNDIDVSLTSGRVIVSFDKNFVNIKDIAQNIQASGFTVKTGHILINVGGMHCAACSAGIEAALKTIDGIISVDVNLLSGKVKVEYYSGMTTLTALRDTITIAGFEYLGSDKEDYQNDEVQQSIRLSDKLKKILIGFLVSALLLSFMFIPKEIVTLQIIGITELIIATPVLIWLSKPVFESAYASLRLSLLNMDVMYAMGIFFAWFASFLATFQIILPLNSLFFDTAVMLATFLLLGRYLEEKAKIRTGDAIKALMQVKADTANVLRNKAEILIPAEDVVVGDKVVIRAGDRLPVDGIIDSGSGYVDESMLTGESMEIKKDANSLVTGGTIATSGSFVYNATHVGADSTLSKIIKLVEDAQNSKPPVANLADRAVTWFIPFVFGIAIISLIFWLIFSDLSFALQRFISVLVVACPCALGLATPTAVTVGIGRAAELGILIKNGNTLEITETVRTMMFDKTGTLTIGKPTVTDIDAFSGEESDLISTAYGLEEHSSHPISEAIICYAKNNRISKPNVDNFESHAGMGLSGVITGSKVFVGSRNFFDLNGFTLSGTESGKIARLQLEGKSVILVGRNEEIVGIIAIADTLRPEAKDAVRMLSEIGVESVMVTGDNQRTAAAIADSAGISRIIAGVLPDEKADEVRRLQQSGERVGFAGDGINDAPALARADSGIAIGSGTDVAIESADIILIRNDLRDVVSTLELSKKVMGRIRLNLFWAFGYNVILIPLAAGLFYPAIIFKPEYGAFAMALSSVSIVTLSLMLKRYTPPARV